ncbi:MAG: NADH-quinone oxidoreductase subunit J [Anaerolineae bacterium]|nr:NADH-quinone oxidoreductase subunit J [Anaerolineae bacterium]
MSGMQIVFLVAAAITLVSAVLVVTLRRTMSSALLLVLTLLGVSVLFVLLQAQFFAVVQVLIYIGAVATLILFVVMLTRSVMDTSEPQVHKNWWLAALVSLVVFVALVVTLSSWQAFPQVQRAIPADSGENLAALGKALVDPNGFALPFEVASILLVATMIGAVYIASERKGEE